MSAIERHIEESRKLCLEFVNTSFDQLLEKVKANIGFIDDMNATNPTNPTNAPGEVGEYVATMIVEAPPAIADLSDIQPINRPIEERADVKELVERMDLEKTGESELSSINDALWVRFVKTIMLAGWTVEKLKASDACKSVIFTKAQSELLKNLECLRFSMKGKEIDLNQALSQNWVTEIEAGIIKEFAAANKLK